MREDTLHLLCDPEEKTPLTLQTSPCGSVRLCGGPGVFYPCNGNIPDFLGNKPLSGLNRRYQAMYNLLSPFYNVVTRAAIACMRASEEEVRRQYLCELDIGQGDRVLEVSVGTGTNLCLLPRHARYFGLDISAGQLAQCRKNLKRAGLEAELFLGLAERLPFRDNSFDVVFHMGGINYFTNPALAVQEMVRVAKPGTKLVIVDETERFAGKLAKIPVVREFFKHEHGAAAPESLAPRGVAEIGVKELFDGRLWCLLLRKAAAHTQPAATGASLFRQRAVSHRG